MPLPSSQAYTTMLPDGAPAAGGAVAGAASSAAGNAAVSSAGGATSGSAGGGDWLQATNSAASNSTVVIPGFWRIPLLRSWFRTRFERNMLPGDGRARRASAFLPQGV